MTTTDYTTQAETFLARNGIKFRATLSDSKAPAWEGPHGHHYRVTLSRNPHHYQPGTSCLTFDFWGSQADADKGIKSVSAYDVLACISIDSNCPDTFTDFCAEFGYEEDSIKALQMFRRCSRFAKRLQEFFTATELEQLSTIQ